MAAVLIVSAECTSGETITVPLPEVVGPNIVLWEERTASFDLGAPLAYVGEVRIKLSGTFYPGLGYDLCNPEVYFDLSAYLWSYMFASESPLCWWDIETDYFNSPRSFSVEQPFRWFYRSKCREPSWDFLLDGQAEVTVIVDALIPATVVIIEWPSADISDAYLIIEGALKLSSPNGGESLPAGSTHSINWTDFRSDGNCPGDYLLDYSADNGQNWIPVDSNSVSNTCSYDWLVPSINSDQSLIRIIDADDPNISDTSDAAFTIYECTLKTDLTGDCVVNFLDFAALMDEWLKCGNPFDPNCFQ